MGPFPRGLVDVTERDDLRLFQTGIRIEVAAAATSKAHDADVDLVICAPHANRGRGGQGSEEKPASFWIRHRETPSSR